MIKIYGRANTGMPEVEAFIKEFLLKRENFKLYNIDNDEAAYLEFLDITKGDANPPHVLVINEEENVCEN
ncbi:MAG: hypothetical protein M1458_01310 [Deltaproteobacteria bacterium]|nr:hypothetical protein [Deltaproteobacteria bacterium]